MTTFYQSFCKRFPTVSVVFLITGISTTIFMQQAHAATAPSQTQITVLALSAVETVNVRPTEVSVTLSLLKTGSDAAKAQAKVNKEAASLVKYLKKFPDVTLKTDGYQVYQKRTGKLYYATQIVTLSGNKTQKIFKLVGELQHQGALLQQTSWSASEADIQRAYRKGTAMALRELKQRSKEVAKHLGLTFIRFKTLSLAVSTEMNYNRSFSFTVAANNAVKESETPVFMPTVIKTREEVSGEAILR